jgi:hypothetical protein
MKEYNIIIGLDGITFPLERFIKCKNQMEADLLAYELACILYKDHEYNMVSKEDVKRNYPNYCEEDIDFLYQSEIDDVIFYTALPL